MRTISNRSVRSRNIGRFRSPSSKPGFETSWVTSSEIQELFGSTFSPLQPRCSAKQRPSSSKRGSYEFLLLLPRRRDLLSGPLRPRKNLQGVRSNWGLHQDHRTPGSKRFKSARILACGTQRELKRRRKLRRRSTGGFRPCRGWKTRSSSIPWPKK